MTKSHAAIIRTASLALALSAATCLAEAATPADLLAGYAARSARTPNAEQGKAFFTARHGRDWACAGCHGPAPVADGRHAATGKSIQPLAPGANPARFTDPGKVEKWFRRNCMDVVGRACTDAEKADVLAWLITLKP
jgi:mono/diheme cytochrome c family protein